MQDTNLDQQYNICRLEFGGAQIADLRRTKILQINQE
jgi:hypothetical protein